MPTRMISVGGGQIPVMQSPGLPVADPVKVYLPRRYWHRSKDNFHFSVEYNTLAASAQAAVQTFQVQNDADFLVCRILGTVANAAGTTESTYWPFTIRILDSGSGASWMNSPTHIANVVGRMSGNGHSDYQPIPRLINAGSTVTVETTNLDSGNAYRIWLTFTGAKIFTRIREG